MVGKCLGREMSEVGRCLVGKCLVGKCLVGKRPGILRRRSDKLLYSLEGLRLEEAMVDMEIDHEIGYKTNIKAGLVLDEVCLKKHKTREEPCIEIGNNVGKDDRMMVDNDHEIGNITNIQASLVLDEVCPKKQKTGWNYVLRLALRTTTWT